MSNKEISPNHPASAGNMVQSAAAQEAEPVDLLPCPFCGKPPQTYMAGGGLAACCDQCDIALLAAEWNRRAQQPAPQVKALEEWHEGLGDCLWWCWQDGEWLGEAPYVGSPLDLGQTVECITHSQNGKTPASRFMVGGWPGYHTHFTPLPAQPAALSGEPHR